MAVTRIHKTKEYTTMSNTHFKEKEMTLKAKGLLSLMLSLPDDWDYSIAGLVTLSKDGKDSVMNALTELESFGYLIRSKITDEKGRFCGYDYDVFEVPFSEIPQQGKPYAENPNTENPPQLNTNKLNTKVLNTNTYTPLTPQGAADGSTEKQTALKNRFGEFWKAYPRKVGKAYAEKAWNKIKPTAELHEKILQAVELQKKQPQWLKDDGQYIPHPSTWLNGGYWENETEVQADAARSAADDEWFKKFAE